MVTVAHWQLGAACVAHLPLGAACVVTVAHWPLGDACVAQCGCDLPMWFTGSTCVAHCGVRFLLIHARAARYRKYRCTWLRFNWDCMAGVNA